MPGFEPLPDITPIPGDDLPYHTIAYRNVAEPYRFKNLPIDATTHPLSYAAWASLWGAADLFYANYEIVGITINDFFDGLKSSWERNADTLERVLAVYDDDIANPVLGRTKTITYNVVDDSSVSDGGSLTEVDVPVDDPGNDQATRRTKSQSAGQGQVKKTGTETEELSDLGVRPNYESLNGFIDNNRPYQMIFIDFFKDNFMMTEGWTW